MKLAIKDGVIVASHANNQNIKNLYGDLEIARVPDNVKLQTITSVIVAVDLNNPYPTPSAPFTNLPADPRLSWGLKESKENALIVLEDIAEEYRTEVLSAKPGKIAGYEAKAKIALHIVESATPNPSDIKALSFEAENKGISVPELAKKILARVAKFAAISTYVDGESQKTKTLIANANTTKEIWNSIKIFEENIINKIGV